MELGHGGRAEKSSHDSTGKENAQAPTKIFDEVDEGGAATELLSIGFSEKMSKGLAGQIIKGTISIRKREIKR